LMNKGKYNESIGYFKRTVSIQPNSPAAIYHLGKTLEYFTPNQQAACYWEKIALLLDERQLVLQGTTSLPACFDGVGYDPEARRFFEEGAHLARSGRFDVALEMYKKGLSIDPENHYKEENGVEPGRGPKKEFQREPLSLSDPPEKKISLYLKALRAEPHNTLILNNLGAAYFKVGEAKKGFGALDRALAISPSNKVVISNLCWYGGKFRPDERSAFWCSLDRVISGR